MAAKQTKSQLQAKLKKGKEKLAGTEVDYGRMEMPAVKGGVAKLTRAEIKAYASGPNKGKYFLSIGGVAVAPESNKEGLRVRGVQTSKQFDLFASKTRDGKVISEDENQATALNEIRKLDADRFDEFEGDTEDYLKELVDEGLTYFGFEVRAYQGNLYENGKMVRKDGEPVKVEKLWTEFLGTAGLPENFDPENLDNNHYQDDDTEESEEEETEDDDNVVENDDDEDLTELGTLADDGDEKAVERMTDLANETEVSLRDDFDDLTWSEVAALILEAQGDDEGSEEPDSEQPVVGDVFKYKNKAGKIGTYEVTEVDLEKETVKLKSTKGPGRATAGWDKLLPADE